MNDLPGWAKGVIAVTITGGVVIGAIYAAKGLKKLLTSDARHQKDEVKETSDDLVTLNSSSATKQSISKSQAESYANSLQQLMDGYGSDEQQIKDIWYHVKNDADVLAIIKAFGIRTISSGYLNPEPDFKGTLPAALRSELSSYWIDKINEIFKNKKIKYRF